MTIGFISEYGPYLPTPDGFTLPFLQRLASTSTDSRASGAKRPIRALILTPTRELAAQVEESVRTYGKYLKLSPTAIFDGVGINPQIKLLQRGVDRPAFVRLRCVFLENSSRITHLASSEPILPS